MPDMTTLNLCRLHVKRGHKSQPLSLKQWFETIISGMIGQLQEKNSLPTVIHNIIVKISDQDTLKISHGLYRVIARYLWSILEESAFATPYLY